MPFSIFGYRFSFAHVSEKYFGIERGLGLRAPRPWALGALAHGESSIIRRSRVNRFLRSRRSDRLAALAASMMRPANSSRGCTPWDYGEPAARCLHLLRYGVWAPSREGGCLAAELKKMQRGRGGSQGQHCARALILGSNNAIPMMTRGVPSSPYRISVTGNSPCTALGLCSSTSIASDRRRRVGKPQPIRTQMRGEIAWPRHVSVLQVFSPLGIAPDDDLY